jgi:hypothetical protein
MEKNLDVAYQNAKKGIYWALTNIPDNRSRIRKDLIEDDRLYSSVKLETEFNGLKIVSTGFENSTEVTITIYRSLDGLIREGYLKLPGEKKETDKKN